MRLGGQGTGIHSRGVCCSCVGGKRGGEGSEGGTVKGGWSERERDDQLSVFPMCLKAGKD